MKNQTKKSDYILLFFSLVFAAAELYFLLPSTELENFQFLFDVFPAFLLVILIGNLVILIFSILSFSHSKSKISLLSIIFPSIALFVGIGYYILGILLFRM